MSDKDMNCVEQITKGLQLQLTTAGPCISVSAEHDIIYGPGTPSTTSADDTAALAELGWHVEDEFDCWAFFT